MTRLKADVQHAALRYGIAIAGAALALPARAALEPQLHDQLRFVAFLAGFLSAR
jgi:hypothetical protein